MNSFIFSLDYFTINCEGIFKECIGFKYISNGQTRIFKYNISVLKDDKLFCTILHTPLSKILNTKLIQIKFENYLLYSSDFFYIKNSFCKLHDFKQVSLSRVDFAFDFVKFENNFSGQELWELLTNNKIRYKGKVTISSLFKYNSEKNKNSVSYFRFGNHNSNVYIILYDKTKEMNEVKYKEYIMERWKMNNIDVKNNNVWRLELSLNTNDFEINDNGNKFKINANNLNSFEVVQYVGLCLLTKYFRFCYNDNKNITRCRELVLLPKYINTTIKKIPSEKTSCRMDKYFIKRLVSEEPYIKELGFEITDIINNLKDKYLIKL